LSFHAPAQAREALDPRRAFPPLPPDDSTPPPFLHPTPCKQNSGLLYCMEYLEESLEEWLGEELEVCAPRSHRALHPCPFGSKSALTPPARPPRKNPNPKNKKNQKAFGDEDYLLIDCPGQIELYNHCSALRTLADYLRAQGWSVAAVYCLDATFFAGGDASKFIAGALQALAAMVRLELPHVNVLTKMDLVAPEDRRAVDELLIPDGKALAEQLSAVATGPQFRRLNTAVASLLDEFSLISFLPLDSTDEESLGVVLGNLDMALQYGEDADVKVRDDDEVFGGGGGGRDDDGGGGGAGDGMGGGVDELARAMQQAILGGGGDGNGNGLGGD
jgi:hypothetical protein